MSELKVKSTVRPRSLIITAAVINAANELNLDMDMLITSGNDSKHMEGSKHYSDEALDFRSKHMNVDECNALMRIVRKRLGKNYQVLLEFSMKPNEHIHIEYDSN
jgi:hypothetical protein